MINKFKKFNYLGIEPKTKKQKAELDRYRKYLGVKLLQEDFTLKCILSFDWNRRIIIQTIDKVKRESSLGMIKFHVTLTAPSHTVNYVVGNPFETKGQFLDTEKERCINVYNELYRYLT